jgi:hypothetical protein
MTLFCCICLLIWMNIITSKSTYDYFLSQFYECKDWVDVVEYNGVLVISGNYKNLSQVLS